MRKKSMIVQLICAIGLLAAIGGCGALTNNNNPSPTELPVTIKAPESTATPTPDLTVTPIPTQVPTFTPIPTAITEPTMTPAPTATPEPTATPTPTINPYIDPWEEVVEAEFPRTGTVDASWLNVRSGAGTYYGRVIQLPDHTKVNIWEAKQESTTKEYWYFISAEVDGKTYSGYVHCNYILVDSLGTTELPDSSLRPKPRQVYQQVEYIGPVEVTALESHGKELKLYGDINPDDVRVEELRNLLGDYGKKISIAVWRKDGKRAVTYNTQQGYFSACTIKIGYMLHICKKLDQGLADGKELLTYEEKHYHTGSGQIRYQDFGTKYSINDLIYYCLSISDNVAYEMLTDYFGYDDYNDMVRELGCKSLQVYDLWASSVKANDYIRIWNEVYDYVVSDAPSAPILLRSCTNTAFNYGTETLTGIDYSHKSGDNFGAAAAYHDAGILWDTYPYVFAVFTNSEGENTDIATVDRAMELLNELMQE